jgi:hypothetical protein
MVAPGEYGDSTQYPYKEFFAKLKPPKVPHNNETLLTKQYGNCYCSLTVVKNQLRPRFSNEIFVAGQKFILTVNLIMKVQNKERTFLSSANAGNNISKLGNLCFF